MSDATIRTLEAAAAANPGDEMAQARLRAARRRAGIHTTPSTSYTVLEVNLMGLQKKVDSLARRGAKLGAAPLSLEVSEERTWVTTPAGVDLPARQVTISGDAPNLGSWRVVARLEHLEDDTVIQSLGGGMPSHLPTPPAGFSNLRSLEAYRHTGPTCEHCGLRRTRRDTYVCVNMATGETDQVGSTCLEDLSGASPARVLYAYDANTTIINLARGGAKVLERCKPCRAEVSPVVTREDPHGVCPQCSAPLEGTAIRTARVPMVAFLLAAWGRTPTRGVWLQALQGTNWPNLEARGEAAIRAIAWAQGREGNQAAALRDRYVEARHAHLVLAGYQAANRLTPTLAPPATVTFSRLPCGAWGLRGQGLQEGQTVTVTRKDGRTSRKRVGRVVRTDRRGFVTAEMAR